MNIKKTDAVVIGSGAAGGLMAYQLARRGLKVVLLERGARHDPLTFEHDEVAMFPRTYMHGGLQTTDDHDVAIAQGCTVGGSTVINNAIWMRADLDRVLADWEKTGACLDMPPHSPSDLKTPRDRLIAAYEEIEEALHVARLPNKLANRGSDVFMEGCRQLDIPAEYLEHNREACIACGWCNYGCRYNRKTSTLVTYIPWAEARGALVLDNCRHARILKRDDHAHAVRCFREGEELTVEADRIVVCAGAIGSSALLLRSGINPQGRVGRGFHILGGAFVTAETDRRLDGFDGIGLACIAEADKNYIIENCFTPPIVLSIGLGGWFLSHFQRMMRYPYIAQAGVMVATDPTGRIWLDRQKRVHIDVKFSERDLARLRAGIRKLSNIFFAGGATKVYPATFKLIDFANEGDIDLIDVLVRRPDDLILGSAHPQGGNPIGEKGVVGSDFRVHGYKNLYVADASVFPTNIWANSQATVMAVAHYAADFVAA